MRRKRSIHEDILKAPRVKHVPLSLMVVSGPIVAKDTYWPNGYGAWHNCAWRCGEVWPSPAHASLMDCITLYNAEHVFNWIRGRLRRKRDAWLISPDPVGLLSSLHVPESIVAGSIKCHLWVTTQHCTVILLTLARGNLWVCSTGQYHQLPVRKLTTSLHRYGDMIDEMIILPHSEQESHSHLVDRHLRALGHILLHVGSWAPDCWAPTASGIAWAAWLRHYKDEPIYLHQDHDITQIERKCTYGGRVQCNYLGKVERPIYRYDVSCHYPSIGTTCSIPTCHIATDSRSCHELLSCFTSRHTVCGLVEIADFERDYPTRHFGTPRWVRGHHRTWLAGEELKRAIEAGSVHRVILAAIYETAPAMSTISKELIKCRYQARDDGNAAIESFTKVAYTGLYGRLARKQTEWARARHVAPRVTVGQWTAYDARTRRVTTYRTLGGYVEVDCGRTNHEQSWQAGAAVFLAQCRAKIDDLVAIAGEDHVYYIGVDGLHVDETGLRHLCLCNVVDGLEPGYLHEDCHGDDAEYFGVFDYRIGSKRVKAGLTPVEVDTSADLKQASLRVPSLSAHSPSPHQYTTDIPIEPRLSPSRSVGRRVQPGWQSPCVLPHPWADERRK